MNAFTSVEKCHQTATMIEDNFYSAKDTDLLKAAHNYSLYKKRSQILQSRFKYKFKNILLLHEALTISFDVLEGDDNTKENNNSRIYLDEAQVSFKKRTFNRLKVVGLSVLKFIACEYALFVCHEDKKTTEGTLTKIGQNLTNNDTLKKVGAYLNLKEFVEINQDSLKSKGFKVESVYPEVVRALFGAVFIDSTRGMTEHGVQNTFVIFFILWRQLNIFKEKAALLERFGRREYEDFFPPKKSAAELLRKRFGSSQRYNIADVDNLEKSLCHKFTKRHVLEQALTHESVYSFPEFKNVGHYQILEFIGDAVFELVICEYLYWHFVDDAEGEYFSRKIIDRLACGKFQLLMALSCGIRNFIRAPPAVNVKNMEDFMEAVIGAIYVDTRRDRGITIVKEYLYNYCFRLNGNAAVILGYDLPMELRKCHSFDIDVTAETFKCLSYHDADIKDLNEFLCNWENFTAGHDQHLNNFTNALQHEGRIKARICDDDNEYIMNKVEKDNLPEYCCNQLEFERIGLYQIAARMYLSKNKNPVVKKKWYGNMLKRTSKVSWYNSGMLVISLLIGTFVFYVVKNEQHM